MTRLDLHLLTKTYPAAAAPAVHNLTVTVNSGELVALLGPSGCGKTTALKLIAGLLAPTSGGICFDGQSILTVPAERRSAVLMFQNHLLFPHLTVSENVGFGLKMRGEREKVIRARVAELLEQVQLAGFERRSPRQLSGGQQQRVALARALILNPRVLLLDEPFSSLDAHLRDELRSLLQRLQRQLGLTTIFVTHDQQEAVMLADRVALLFNGQLQQYAPPRELYTRPASCGIARFFGHQNFIQGIRRGSVVETSVGPVALHEPSPEGPVTLTIRPEQVRIAPANGHTGLMGEVVKRTYVGTHSRVSVRLSAEIVLEALTDAMHDVRLGERVHVTLPAEALWPLPYSSASATGD